MPVDVEQVIRIQGLDLRITELKREIETLPKQIAEIERQLDTHTRRVEADKAALAANQRDRKKIEGDIQVQEAKISKLKDQTLQAKTNEQYRAFQHEVEYCQNEIRKFEDRILELMGDSEALEAAVKTAEASLKSEKVQVDAQKKAAHERIEGLKKELAEFEAERATEWALIPGAMQREYDRLRRKFKNGVVVGEVADGTCQACHMIVRPRLLQELKTASEPMACENCGRLLHYNPPVAFDHDIDSAAKSGAN